MNIPFDNTYTQLPGRFFARQEPARVPEPKLIRLNRELAATLSINVDWLESADGVATLAGNAIPEGAEPIAQAYAGHQFGGFSPQLGDGRAILLGEVIDPNGARFDLQLKGSGRTPFSRGGDGKSALGPVLREYIVSEAMAALGVPTTRALAAVATGETVMRQEGPLQGGVFTRVAASHIRVGTFQYFLARNDIDALRLLADHAIARHYSDAADAPAPYVALLKKVAAAQADLIAQWMALGFIHGVMNTDNTAISGGDDRLWPVRVHGRLPLAVRLQLHRHRCALCLGQPARHWALEPSPVSRTPCCRCYPRTAAKRPRSPKPLSPDILSDSAASTSPASAPKFSLPPEAPVELIKECPRSTGRPRGRFHPLFPSPHARRRRRRFQNACCNVFEQ